VVRQTLDLPPPLAVVSAHRRRRGPYTAAGSVVRAVAADALARAPELGPRHHIELLSAAPELDGQVPAIKVALELTAASGARTRYQARLHTLRISHGLVEFLRDYLVALDAGPRSLVVEDLAEADPTDHEFLAVLVRRVPASLLSVVVGSDERPVVDPPGPVTVSLPAALSAHTTRIDVPGTAAVPDHRDPGSAYAASLAQAYVDSDGTSDDPAELAAYQGLAPDRRAQLHDARAVRLREQGERSLAFGAIPFHAANGTDPAKAGVAAVREAQLHCKNLGLYHAAVEFGLLGRSIMDRSDTLPDLWWQFTGDATTSLSALGRAEEAEAMYAEARAMTADPEIHMHAAYATAMLYARHYDDDRRDPYTARQWLNVAVALASLLPDLKERAFHSVFNRNGIALVETREGRPDKALELLNLGMAWLDRELAPGEQMLHRTGLRYNRAQVYLMTGRLEEALADLDAVIEVDPNFHDHYFNRANVLRRLGRSAEAIEDYGRSLDLSPPYPEVYYNRADAKLELGDVDGALADFGRAIELDPSNVDALLNRAGLRSDLGDETGAWADVTAGLAQRPHDAHLLCLKARLLADRGEADTAREAVTSALDANPGMAEAWAIRGSLAYASGDLEAAMADLSQAVSLTDVPQFRFNRAAALESAGRFIEAADDYAAVLASTEDEDARLRMDFCLQAAGGATAAHTGG